MLKSTAREILHDFVREVANQGMPWADAEDYFALGLPCEPMVDEAYCLVPEAYTHILYLVYTWEKPPRHTW